MIPDNVEKIIMTKEDYDRNVEQMIFEKIELQQALYSIEDDLKNIINGITNEINSVNNLGEPLTKEEIIKLLSY